MRPISVKNGYGDTSISSIRLPIAPETEEFGSRGSELAYFSLILSQDSQTNSNPSVGSSPELSESEELEQATKAKRANKTVVVTKKLGFARRKIGNL